MRTAVSLAASISERQIWDAQKINRYRIENADHTACIWASSLEEAQADLARTPGGKLIDEHQESPWIKETRKE